MASREETEKSIRELALHLLEHVDTVIENWSGDSWEDSSWVEEHVTRGTKRPATELGTRKYDIEEKAKLANLIIDNIKEKMLKVIAEERGIDARAVDINFALESIGDLISKKMPPTEEGRKILVEIKRQAGIVEALTRENIDVEHHMRKVEEEVRDLIKKLEKL